MKRRTLQLEGVFVEGLARFDDKLLPWGAARHAGEGDSSFRRLRAMRANATVVVRDDRHVDSRQ